MGMTTSSLVSFSCGRTNPCIRASLLLKIEGVTGLGNLARVREPLTGSILALLVLLQFGCGGASGGAPPRGSGGTSPAPAASSAAGARAGLAQVATLSSPTAMAIRNGDSSLYFIEQGGPGR